MICGLCEGMQNLICTQPSYSGAMNARTKKWEPDSVTREWYPCPACGGTGVRVQAGPSIIYPTRARKRGFKA
jgi:hypothetical protein